MSQQHRVTTETSFVCGSKSVNTGSCGEFGPAWNAESRNEAQRIADGLGGTVVEETPVGERELLRLAVVVDGRTVARVHAGVVGS